MIDHYDWAGGREAMMRFGPDTGPVVVMLLPLFEEHNRTRTFAVTICRALAALGMASVLPDVPGQGESLVPLEDMTLLRMREAVEGVETKVGSVGRPYAVGIRSGALLDPLGLFFGRWHLAPQQGEDVMRDLLRIALAGKAIASGSGVYALMGSDNPVVIAGNPISGAMAADLQGAMLYDEPGVRLRTIRLDTDSKPADAKFPGAPLWRRSEPGNDPALAALLAADIADWVRACDG